MTSRGIAEGILFTDLYQLTMAQLYFQRGMHDTAAQFDYFFRETPDYGGHKAGYCVFAGLADLLDFIGEMHVTDGAIERLREMRNSGGSRVFGDDFLHWLRSTGGFESLRLRAIPEGRVVHPGAPLAVAQGQLAIVQLLETALLNKLNFPTLIATKASRLKRAARGAPVFELGMRRGQGLAVNTATRAAMIGGADASSNTGASLLLGIPPVGTHAHSMVQAFIAAGGNEIDAFRAYAETYPDNCLLLVDTIDTINSGLANAITVFEELRAAGHEPIGIRLDSGDLAHLAIVCARELDRAGFPDASITLSNQLDELTIWQVLTQIEEEAGEYGVEPERLVARLRYGVGTQLVVSGGAPALDGVYKLVALQRGDDWRPAIKLSDTPAKVTNPGEKTLYRVYDERGMATADVIARTGEKLADESSVTLYHAGDPEQSRVIQAENISSIEPLLEEVWVEGKRKTERETIATLRKRRLDDESRLDPGVLRLLNPHVYHVSLSPALWRLKRELIAASRAG
ncbi:MAG: nicotinate phosphoribosyltransferase [Trueperaceae bacterium]